MIAGFEDVTSGQVLADGKKVEKPEPSRGVVFQNIALFPWMTTMGNVEYGLKSGVSRKRSGAPPLRNTSIWSVCTDLRIPFLYSFPAA